MELELDLRTEFRKKREELIHDSISEYYSLIDNKKNSKLLCSKYIMKKYKIGTLVTFYNYKKEYDLENKKK